LAALSLFSNSAPPSSFDSGESGALCLKPLSAESIDMKCDLCEKTEATVHLTQTFGDMARHADLCEACAKANGVNDPTGFSLATSMETLKKRKQLIAD